MGPSLAVKRQRMSKKIKKKKKRGKPECVFSLKYILIIKTHVD